MEHSENSIAIIGMSGRFPGAGEDLELFWQNLENGVESVRRFNKEELLKMGIDEHLIDNPRFVAADAILEDVDQFDAPFFDFPPREAQILDPQHRMFLEASWQAIEYAGYAPDNMEGRVGVYAGSALSAYMFRNLKSNPGLIEDVGTFKTMLANDKDFLATRISYKFGFTGASLNVNTLCSSSAAAIAMACDSLVNFQNDVALAGGVSLQLTRNEAYFYQEGNIGSADGHCRAFDERASGTVSGSGLGVVLLKRLEDAIEDGDNILAVVKGWAINNDGADKSSYTAPSVDGQADVIMEALEMAEVSADTISYMEAHGTGTQLGDPIEIAGLTKAYRQTTDKKQYCAIGSVKTNIGHLVTAGGVASLIKTVQAFRHKTIPQSLNYERPNPKIDFQNSPFYVADKCAAWNVPAGQPRRAGLSSFGIGGTNVHLVLEEAPAQQQVVQTDNRIEENSLPMVFPFSAKSQWSLDAGVKQFADLLKTHPNLDLTAMAHTLQTGRSNFEFRQAIVARSAEELLPKLQGEAFESVYFNQAKTNSLEPVLMFSGQGSQSVGCVKSLYGKQPAYTAAIDECLALLPPELKDILQSLMFASAVNDGPGKELNAKCKETRYAQPLLFIAEYAMTQQLMTMGCQPSALIGHSLGEYVAACIAGVMSLKDALNLVVQRGAIMHEAPPGAMLSVAMSRNELMDILPAGLELAAENGPTLCVVAGAENDVEQFAQQLQAQSIQSTLLHTDKAFHSRMMEPLLDRFRTICGGISYQTPEIALISNVTGEQLNSINADYWVEHLRQPVNFARGISSIVEMMDPVLIEVGPGQALSKMARMSVPPGTQVINTYPAAAKNDTGELVYFDALAHCWLSGIELNWQELYQDIPNRMVLPTYAFERQSYWIEEMKQQQMQSKATHTLADSESLQDAPITGALAKIAFEVDLPASDDSRDPDKSNHRAAQVLDILRSAKAQIKDIMGDDAQNTSIGLYAEHDQQANVTQLTNTDARRYVKAPFVEPSTDLEKRLAASWQKALGVASVGVQDNFFELGGHSLIAAALANELISEFNAEIPLVELLEHPTVAGLATLIEERRASDSQDDSEEMMVERI